MTKLNNIIEAIERAHVDLRVGTNPALYSIAGIAATGDASHDDVLGAVMRAHPRLDPLVQLKLADRIDARLKEPLNRSAPQRRPANAEMIYSAPSHRILSVR